ncbi:MAG: DNA replication and repair protein RecF [Ignavibacteria bacterium]|nr:DNA replication and repair protein RecF [Ignavibacteria bacterium]MBT8381494.1 DNA replication and repair protein RecF [Ignavibacteria bacterium]MBT8391556.1 DNA replication and repair protein RecF [Ignavibacteria bacterium]NNJ52248.1 DNA replication and repair protein RecF [Ignavibacteriaceae bacterium]NNL22725.1 DNA replication and repair protein RecF [Ignavibacteriaceae bacterium]
MSLTSISLRNVRKHTDTEINFAGGLNYIVGGNGLGKTTILESIYYLCTTKSCCSKSDANVVKFDEDIFEINGTLEGLTKDSATVIYSVASGKKQYYLNEKQIFKASSVIGKFPVVMLSPSDHAVTQGSPAERRKFIDSVISQSSRTYLDVLLEYQKILRHRSALLMRIREGDFADSEMELEAWNQKLMSAGEQIINHRVDFLKGFNSYVAESYNKIMGKMESPGITYLYLGGTKSDNISKTFKDMLSEYKVDEIRRAANLVGPHRDDFIFEINNINLREFGSQGQHKTFQTVLRFAEFFYIKDVSGNTPIFLLDDVFGELDAQRAKKVSEYLSDIGGQAFITLTDFGNISFLKAGEKDRVIKLNEDSKIAYA